MKPLTNFLWILFSATCGFNTSFAQGQGSIEDLLSICEEIPCYPAESVFVNMDDGTVKEFPSQYPVPKVQGNWISIFPGKAVFVAGDFEGGILANLRVVEEPEVKKDVIHIRMFQEPGEPDTYLVVTNYFSELIKYRAGMMYPDSDDVYATSSCPVMNNGRSVYEHWPFPIFQLVLADIHAISQENDEMVCE